MLKRAATLARKARESTSGNGAKLPRNLNLQQSPLMRWAAGRVARGDEASVIREVASAAIAEVGHTGKVSSRLSACE